MKTHYLEQRGPAHNLSDTMADTMRHLHARQHLGKAVIVCQNPAELLALAQKHWLKLSRDLQRRRTTAMYADQILRYTYTITHMQHLGFVAAPPHEQPDAAVYFITPDQMELLPANCFTLYLAAAITPAKLRRLIGHLPVAALVVDYRHQILPDNLDLRPKAELEMKVRSNWRTVETFLAQCHIDITPLANHNLALLDDALDAVLDDETEFLRVAVLFQRTLNLARPLLTITKAERDRYEALVRLAYQVQTLSPQALPAEFLKTYTDDSFFLHDTQALPEPLEVLVARHTVAGRRNLVRALMQFGAGQTAMAPRLLPA